MKLSFVIPAYNEEAYLSKCLESILQEKAKHSFDIEVIVVNNASTDQTRKIAESFPGIIIVDEPRKGLTQARQAGLRAASGELIANVDADTVLPEAWIGTVIKQFSKDEKLIALSGPFIYYDLPLKTNVLVRVYYSIGYAGYLFNRFVLKIGSMLQGGNFVVRKSAIEEIGGYNLDIPFYGEDSDAARRLHKIGKVRFTFRLPMYTSGRRLKSEGLFKMALKYPVNYIWVTFFKKPYHQSYTDVRPK